MSTIFNTIKINIDIFFNYQKYKEKKILLHVLIVALSTKRDHLVSIVMFQESKKSDQGFSQFTFLFQGCEV